MSSNKERAMGAAEKIEGTVENWESGALGRDPLHAKRAPKALEKEMDDAQGLQAISIRLRKDLIEDFKFIAKHHGMGYQPLMRQALKLFAESEFKRIAVQLYNEKEAKVQAEAAKAEAEAAQAEQEPMRHAA